MDQPTAAVLEWGTALEPDEEIERARDHIRELMWQFVIGETPGTAAPIPAVAPRSTVVLRAAAAGKRRFSI